MYLLVLAGWIAVSLFQAFFLISIYTQYTLNIYEGIIDWCLQLNSALYTNKRMTVQ